MRELMKKLGVESYDVEVDVLVEGRSFIEIEDYETLMDYMDSDISLKSKVYCHKSQKQVFELSENKTYSIAHAEQKTYHKFYNGLSKDSVIKFVGNHLEDYKDGYVMIFESDDYVSLDKYIELMETELTFVPKTDIICLFDLKKLPAVEVRKFSTDDRIKTEEFLDKVDLVFEVDKTVGLQELKDDRDYLLYAQTGRGYARPINVVAYNQSKKKILQYVSQCIEDYSNGDILIFDYADSASPHDYLGESSHVCCHACCKDASKAVWKDVVILRGEPMVFASEVKLEELLDGESEVYDCDTWFEALEEEFKKSGKLGEDESLDELLEVEFFARAFSNSENAFKGLDKTLDIESGAYCVHCHVLL